MKIYYFGFFSSEDKTRSFSPASNQLCRYVLRTLSSLNYNVIAVNCAPEKKPFHFSKFNKTSILNNINTFVLKSFSFGKIFRRLFQNIILQTQAKKFVKSYIRPGDLIIFYHSLIFCPVYKYIKSKTKNKIILQVEELYCDVGNKSNFKKRKEIELIKICDKHIFASDVLRKKIFGKENNSPILYGEYLCYNHTSNKFSTIDHKIHIVYSGTFDKNKGGAINVLKIAQLLTDKYVVHILGFGDDNYLKKYFASHSFLCEIKFDGFLSGDDFINFLSQCDIGINSQDPEKQFNLSSFPSKILTYFGCGLAVLCSNSPSVYDSKLNEFVVFYSDFADCITKIKDIKLNYDYRKLILKLDEEFKKDIGEIIHESFAS